MFKNIGVKKSVPSSSSLYDLCEFSARDLLLLSLRLLVLSQRE